MSNEYLMAAFIALTIIVGLIGYLAYRDTKVSYEIKGINIDRYKQKEFDRYM